MNKKRIASLGAVTLAAAAIVAACGGGDTVYVERGTVIQNSTIIDTRNGSHITGMSIIIDGGKIQRITGDGVQVTGSGVAIDATGKYVVPGFLDMHTHLLDSSVAEQPLVQKLFIANGITGIREMRGAPELVASAKQMNADRAAGKIDAPEILIIPGATFGVNAPPVATISPTAAVQEVQAQKVYGAGFIKTTNATHDAALAFLGEAKNQGLYVAGHLNPSLSAKDSANAGWHAVEHLGSGMGVLLDCSTAEAAIRATLIAGNGVVPAPNPPTWTANTVNAPLYQRAYDTYDAARCASVAQVFAQNGTWHAPTLIRLRTQRFVEDALYRTDPNLVYVSKSIRANWEAAAVRQTTSVSASAIATFHQYFNHEQSLPLLLKQNGVKLLAGSDTAVISNWCIPGVSLHQEFALLAAGGLSPLEVLQTTTLNGAQFLGRTATMGTVEEGKNADLVLLDGDPTASVANLDKIAAVVLQGKYFSSSALALLKSSVQATYAAQAAPGPGALAVADHTD